MTAADQALAPEGLTGTEAAARLAAQGEREAPSSSRSRASIVRANVVTPFNIILTALGVVTLIFGDWRDALFLGIVAVSPQVVAAIFPTLGGIGLGGTGLLIVVSVVVETMKQIEAQLMMRNYEGFIR